MKKNVDKFHLS